jgi:ABC-type branched-subunit amino acid transport system permease subunit
MSVAVSEAPATFSLPTHQRLFSRTAWIAFFLIVAVVLLTTPICALAVPSSSPFFLSVYALTLIGKIMCYALVALALDLVWGYCGVLSLGHGLFFALGGYAMGMYLMRSIGFDGVYHNPLPDFMVFVTPDHSGPWCCGLGLWVLHVSFPGQGRLPFDHHPGNDLRRHAALLSQRNRLRWQ